MKHIEKIIGIILLLIGVGFNLWTYRLEPTALGDPNDNTFTLWLIEQTKYGLLHNKSVRAFLSHFA